MAQINQKWILANDCHASMIEAKWELRWNAIE
jgi:hypothetical protein